MPFTELLEANLVCLGEGSSHLAQMVEGASGDSVGFWRKKESNWRRESIYATPYRSVERRGGLKFQCREGTLRISLQ